MKCIFRTTQDFLAQVRSDLERPHAFAYERIGFITAKAAIGHENLVLLADQYYPVAETDYIPDRTVGARINSEAIRKALEIALLNPVGIFHVHMHTIPGPLWFSRIDLQDQVRLIPDFFSVRPTMPHGALVLSPSSAAGRVWISRTEITRISEFNITGTRQIIRHSQDDGSTDFHV